MKPTVGRIVHYIEPSYGMGHPWAALITKVEPNEALHGNSAAAEERQYRVSLCVFYENGNRWLHDVPFTSTLEVDCWTWPPRT